MMLAELTGLEIAGLITTIAVGVCGIILGVIGLNKKTESVISPQPLTVEVVEALHEQFAAKEMFESHVNENKREHDNFFAKIGGVERGAAANLAGRFDRISDELTEQGKDIAGLKKETELQNQTLASVQSDIKIILGRIPRHFTEK